MAAPPRRCSFSLGPRPLHGGIGPSYPSYGGRGFRNKLKAKKKYAAADADRAVAAFSRFTAAHYAGLEAARVVDETDASPD